MGFFDLPTSNLFGDAEKEIKVSTKVENKVKELFSNWDFYGTKPTSDSLVNLYKSILSGKIDKITIYNKQTYGNAVVVESNQELEKVAETLVEVHESIMKNFKGPVYVTVSEEEESTCKILFAVENYEAVGKKEVITRELLVGIVLYIPGADNSELLSVGLISKDFAAKDNIYYITDEDSELSSQISSLEKAESLASDSAISLFKHDSIYTVNNNFAIVVSNGKTKLLANGRTLSLNISDEVIESNVTEAKAVGDSLTATIYAEGLSHVTTTEGYFSIIVKDAEVHAFYFSNIPFNFE